MQNIIYLKKYEIDTNCTKPKLLLRKFIYLYKNIFNIITKKDNIWILPITEKYTIEKLNSILKKCKDENNIYILEKDLKKKEIYFAMKDYGINRHSSESIKKILIDKVIEYIIKIQNVVLNELETTILVNDDSEINNYIIKRLATEIKSLKIVSEKIYKFKNIEKELYNNYGIAVEFSNSYKKSLAKSKLIINLDFDDTKLNEYKINYKAIIINCIENNIKIKNKLFNGAVINKFEINFDDKLIKKYNINCLKNEFDSLDIYGSILINKSINEAIKIINDDNIYINNLIGNNGKISKEEFI